MRNKYMLIAIVGIAAGVLLASAVFVLAGSTDSPSGPTDSASQMYTLQQVYDRINDGTAAISMTFTEPDSGPPTGTMKTLNQIYDLASERSRPAKTGQTASYATGDDGDLEKGVTWPNPRFTDNSDGTVTDNLTGLIWLKDADCLGTKEWEDTGPTYPALEAANTLNSGECGLTDGSVEGDWRLPNVREMQSLVHYGCYNPALPDTLGTGCGSGPFTGVQSYFYWSSTTEADATAYAWVMYLDYGDVRTVAKSNTFYVWPVRGGQ